MTNAVVNFIADDLISLSVAHFKTLLGTLDSQYQLPSRKYLSTVLLKKQNDLLKNNVLDELQRIKIINLTVDHWSNHQMKSHLGIAGHYV